MESFALLRMHLQMCGIEVSNNTSKIHPFNVKNLKVFILVCATVSLIAISINEANTFDDYMDVLFRSVSMGACGIIYEIIVWKTTKLFEFINILAETVSNSEYWTNAWISKILNKNNFHLISTYCVHRTRKFRVENIVHGNWTKNGTINWDFGLCFFESCTTTVYMAYSSYQLFRIFYDRFGKFGIWNTRPFLVKLIRYHFRIALINANTHQNELLFCYDRLLWNC